MARRRHLHLSKAEIHVVRRHMLRARRPPPPPPAVAMAPTFRVLSKDALSFLTPPPQKRLKISNKRRSAPEGAVWPPIVWITSIIKSINI